MKIKLYCLLLAIAASLFFSSCAHFEQSRGIWGEEDEAIQTKYVAVKFPSARISEVKRSLEVKDIEEIDVLYKEVFDFLKKRLGDEKTILTPVRVGITIYASPRRLDKVYRSLGGKEARMEAFYAAGTGEIYISLWCLDWWRLAHEFAHHILRKELGLNLPEKEEEYLARCAGEFL